MRLLLLALLFSPGVARAQGIPHTYQKDAEGKLDPTSIQENFDYLQRQIKQNKVAVNAINTSLAQVSTITGYAFLQTTQTFSGGNTFTGLVAHSSAATFASTATFSFNGPVSTPTANSLYANNIVKAWVTFDGTTATILDAFNVARITHPGTGQFTIVWAQAFANANYFMSCSAGGTDFEGSICGPNADATTTTVSITARDSAGNRRDFSHICVLAIGKQ